MNSVEELVKAMKAGLPIILIDDEDRENEGDLVIAAEHATPEVINFMVKECRGLVCLSLTDEQIKKLELPLMVRDEFNSTPYKTAFTVSIEAATGVTTGISAFDRAHTISAAINPNAKCSDVVMPGHIFPLKAQKGGVLKRAGHSEGSIDLARMAGKNPSAVICEILNDDGTMARLPDLEKFAQKHRLMIGTIADLIRYRLSNESLVEEVASSLLPTKFGKPFTMRVFKNKLDSAEHVALQLGEIIPEEPVLVRVHSECMTGDVFGSQRCDCGEQLKSAILKIQEVGKGVVLYLRQEGRGIGLVNKIKAYALQDKGMDTVEANIHLGFRPDERDYGVGAQILRSLGAKKLRLLTNNPAKRAGLVGYGITIVEKVPLEVKPSSGNFKYLQTKVLKMGHDLKLEEKFENPDTI